MNIKDIFRFRRAYQIAKGSRMQDGRTASNEVLKKLGKAMADAFTSRPQNGEVNSTEYIAPYYPYPLRTLYDVADYCDIIAGCKGALRRELFRKGYEVMPAEESDTEDTDSEQEIKPTEGQELKGPEVAVEDSLNEKKRQEDKKRKQIIEKLEKINSNNQTIIDVLKELEDDINTIDICYLMTPHDYELSKNGEIISKKMTEALRVSPINMGLIMNEFDEFGRDNDGNWIMCAVEDRNTAVIVKAENKEKAVDSRGRKLYPVYYCQVYGQRKYHFFEWEMLHSSRYKPTKRIGFSPVVTIWQKARTLFFQDKYLWELYEGKRPPKGMLVFNTPNQDSVNAAWNDMVQRAQENPHFVPVMALPSTFGGESNGGKVVEFIDFMKNLNDLSFVEQRDQHRREIGFVYGVSPILINDTSTGGGLNNEGMQYTVTNRAVEEGQSFHNLRHLKRINDLMGNEGWLIKLRPSEEQDEMAKLERISKSLEIARNASSMGLLVDWNEKTGEAVIKGGPVQPPAQEGQGFGEASPENGGGNFEPLPGSNEQSGKPEKPEDAEKSDVVKAKVYLKPGESPPKGVTVQHGEKGGSFYESGASPTKEIESFGEYNADAQDDPLKNPLHPDSLTPEQKARWGQCEARAKEYVKQNGGKVYSAGGHAVALTPDGIVYDYVLNFEGPLAEYEKKVPYAFTASNSNMDVLRDGSISAYKIKGVSLSKEQYDNLFKIIREKYKTKEITKEEVENFKATGDVLTLGPETPKIEKPNIEEPKTTASTKDVKELSKNMKTIFDEKDFSMKRFLEQGGRMRTSEILDVAEKAGMPITEKFTHFGPAMYEIYKNDILKAAAEFKSSLPYSMSFQERDYHKGIAYFLGTLGTYGMKQDKHIEGFIDDLRKATDNNVSQINNVLKYMGAKIRVKTSGLRASPSNPKTKEEIKSSLTSHEHAGISYKVGQSFRKGSTFKSDEDMHKGIQFALSKIPEHTKNIIKQHNTVVHFGTRSEITALYQDVRGAAGFYDSTSKQVYIYPSKNHYTTLIKLPTRAQENLRRRGYDSEFIKKLTESVGTEKFYGTIIHELGHAIALNEDQVIEKTEAQTRTGFVYPVTRVKRTDQGLQTKYDEFRRTPEAQGVMSEDSDPDPTYITRYAATNSNEDFAEHFAYYGQHKEFIDGEIAKDSTEIFSKPQLARFKWLKKEAWGE